MPGHDIIVIGASAGGIEAVSTVIEKLPADIDAAILVVIHTVPYGSSVLDKVLGRRTSLTVKTGENGETIKKGIIYTALPDHHLLVKGNKINISHGPRENRWRPAIDPLFRSVAVAYDSRAIGIILSGNLDDGAAGLNVIKRCGGIAIVQRPEDALFPDMPKNAINNTSVDYTLPASEIGSLLNELVSAEASSEFKIPEDIKIESKLEGRIMNNNGAEEEDKIGNLSIFTCPDCGGSLWRINDNSLRRYRCYLGHSYTESNLMERQDETIEKALYSALRIMEEKIRLFDSLIRESKAGESSNMLKSYKDRKNEFITNAKAIKKLLLN